MYEEHTLQLSMWKPEPIARICRFGPNRLATALLGALAPAATLRFAAALLLAGALLLPGAGCTTHFTGPPPHKDATIPPGCGNGVLEPGEGCDDGNALAGDGCDTDCQVEPGWECTGEPSVCVLPTCGDGVIDQGESCDGSNLGTETCETQGFQGGELACNETCDGYNTSGCISPECGNGVLDTGEQCDDGNTATGDGCNANCHVEPGWECSGSPSTCSLLCGNGRLDPGEQCDGTLLGGQDCTTVPGGFVGGSLACTADCRFDTTECTTCGNGVIETGEACDDGNATAGDGCNANCQVEPHFACDSGSPSTCACVTHVSAQSSAPNPDGLSWSTAFTTVRQGIDDAAALAAAQGRTCEVWVAAGTYGIYQGNPSNTVLLTDDVAVLGGFTGNETWRDDRDPENNVTVLDGGGNIYHVVTADGVTGAELSGFVIQGGNASGSSWPDDRGGGLVVLNGAELQVSQCWFQQNSAVYGGGVYSESANLSLWGVVFENNSATQNGGGLYLDGAAPSMAYDLLFSNNSADSGGGAYVNQASVAFQRVTWVGNQATNGAGGAGGAGGGILFDGATGSVVNGLFVDNSAAVGGGAIGAAWSSSVEVTHCTFTGNSSGNSGSAVYIASFSSVTLLNSIVWNNSGTAFSSVPSSQINASYCDIEGGFSGQGNIDQDPEFVLPGHRVFHLLQSSPCVDSGDGAAGVTEDLDGLPRPVDVGGSGNNTGNGPPWVDMGAYEVQ